LQPEVGRYSLQIWAVRSTYSRDSCWALCAISDFRYLTVFSANLQVGNSLIIMPSTYVWRFCTRFDLRRGHY